MSDRRDILFHIVGEYAKLGWVMVSPEAGRKLEAACVLPPWSG
jgi:hypothetical protein